MQNIGLSVRRLSYIERLYFTLALNELSIYLPCLQHIDIKGTTIYWNDELDVGNLSLFVPKSNSIHLASKFISKEHLLPCIVHELTHKYQLKTMGYVLYTLFDLPYIRIYLDKEADINQMACEMIIYHKKDLLKSIEEVYNKHISKGK